MEKVDLKIERVRAFYGFPSMGSAAKGLPDV